MMTEEQQQDLAAECRRTIADAEKPSAGYRTVARGEIARIALAALTQPASPAFKLPPSIEPEDVPGLIDATANPDEYACCVGKDVWDACLREVAKLNAPHTAQIEPICATGGAEWVKFSEQDPPHKQYVLAADFSGLRKYSPCEQNPTVAMFGDWFDDGKPTWDDGDGGDIHLMHVTHWMALPAAPI